MKKILIALTPIYFMVLIGSALVSQNVRGASSKEEKNPHTHIWSHKYQKLVTLCFNTKFVSYNDEEPES